MTHNRGTAHQHSILNLLRSLFEEAEMSTWGNPGWGRYKNHQIKNWITNVKNAAVHFTLKNEKKKNAQLLADLFPIKRLNFISFNTFETTYFDCKHNIIYSVLSIDTKYYQLPKYHPLSFKGILK